MDQELKQRLIGAAVVTALAAIFIPMLFDDPIDTSGQAVSEMTIPEPPANPPNGPEAKLPVDASDIDNTPAPGNPPGNGQPASAANGTDTERVEPELQEPPMDYEPPAEADTTMEKRLDQAAEGQTIPVRENTQEPAAPASAAAPEEPGAEDFAPEKNLDASPAESGSAPAAAETKKTPVKPTPPAPTKAPAKTQAAPSEAKAAPKAPTAKAGPGFERWYIQAGSYSKKENALSQWETLRKQGLPVVLETQTTPKGTVYRLKIGPELSKQRAADIKNRLAQQNIKSIILAE